MRTMLLMMIVAAVSIGVYRAAAAHPSDGYTPRELDPSYGQGNYGYPPECNFAEIEFTLPLVDPDILTDAERYIIAGTENSPWGEGLEPWWETVYWTAVMYCEQQGAMPEELSLDVIRAVASNYDEVDPLWHDIYLSPLTGRFPRLNALEHSPGDVYMRRLSEDEIRQMAQYDRDLYELYFNHVQVNPVSGERWAVKLETGVYYMRVYGWNGVIFEIVNCGWNRT